MEEGNAPPEGRGAGLHSSRTDMLLAKDHVQGKGSLSPAGSKRDEAPCLKVRLFPHQKDKTVMIK